jgi:signal transduction histidine kinase
MTPGRTSNEHSDREVSDFLLRACHDLRASSRAVRVHSELILKDGTSGPVSNLDQRLGFVVDGAKKLDALIDAITSYSVALATDTALFQTARMDILLRSVLKKLEPEVRACNAEVTYGTLPALNGNPDRLMQVFEHLIRNAIVHRADGAQPRITIDAKEDPPGWLFTIRDNGPGIEESALEKVFLPFERLKGKQLGGAGLGLAICRVIVERHGGRIWAESKAGEGATFCFVLPSDES